MSDGANEDERRPGDPVPSMADELQAGEAATRALTFLDQHPEMIATKMQSEEIAQNPNSVRMVNRYHGEGHDLSQRVMPWAGRGRGVCRSCKHPIYYDDRAHLQSQMPQRFLCVLCVLATGSVPIPLEAQAVLRCPSGCPHKANGR